MTKKVHEERSLIKETTRMTENNNTRITNVGGSRIFRKAINSFQIDFLQQTNKTP